MSPAWEARRQRKCAKFRSFAKAWTIRWWMGYLRASLNAYDPNSLKRIRRRKIQKAKSRMANSLCTLLFVRIWMLVVRLKAIKSNGIPNHEAASVVIDRNSFWLCWFGIWVAWASSPIRITGIAPLRPFCGAFSTFVAIIWKWEKEMPFEINNWESDLHFRDEFEFWIWNGTVFITINTK